MSEQFYCDICGAPMVLEKRLPNHRFRLGTYRRRRFKCTVCDFKKMIVAGGSGDEKHYPNQAIDDVKKMYEQEEINRQP